MGEDTRAIFVENLKKQMKLNNKSQADLSKDLNLPFTTISNWYRGIRYPRPDKMQLLADYFGIRMEELISNSINNSGIKIPILGTVIAGIPVTAVEDIIGYEEISEKMARCGDYFALEIKGDSMEPKMSKGDIVIVKQQNTVENGQIAIVLVNGDEATVNSI